MASESFQCKSLDSPDETRSFEHGKAEVVTLGDFTASRLEGVMNLNREAQWLD